MKTGNNKGISENNSVTVTELFVLLFGVIDSQKLKDMKVFSSLKPFSSKQISMLHNCNISKI
jgi:hypothetical protein